MTKPLISGIDTLVLALEILWKDSSFFDSLSQIKEKAKTEDRSVPAVIWYRCGKEKWLFNVNPYGTRGYEWLLTSKEFNLRIGNYLEPETRPSVMVEIGSEALWRIGPLEIYERVIDLLEEKGGHVQKAKVSRADLCLDILLDERKWNFLKLQNSKVCRGRKEHPFYDCGVFESYYLGKGEVMLRLYDKPREIKRESHKYWMYDLWGVKEGDIQEGKRLIRVEFQLRREAIKELGAGNGMQFFENLDRLWAYCTEKWVQFKDGNGKHHLMRKTLPWWKVVQKGFLGVQGAEPAIRKKAIREDKKQLQAQIMGLSSSLTALEMEERKLDPLNFDGIELCMNRVIESQRLKGYKLNEYKENVIRKRAKYSRQITEAKNG